MGLRILLLTTVFPPTNATGARRPYYMARRLRDEGHQVTVVHGRRAETQPWNADLKDIRSISLELTDLPPGMSAGQRLLANWHRTLRGSRVHGPLRVIADLLLPLEHGTRWSVTPFALADKVGPQDVVIATGPGWSTFEYGHQLAAKWNASYFVDYRDPWSIMLPEVALHTVTYLGGWMTGALRRKRMLMDERRFTANATGVTAATPVVLENALRVAGRKPGHVMLNGFEPHHRARARERNTVFTMVYTGSVYREQEWDLVANGLQLLRERHPELGAQLRLVMAGVRTDHDPELRTVAQLLTLTPLVVRADRLDRESAAALQASADLLLHVGFKGKKGIFPIKFIEYLNAGPPILQASTGHDMMEQALERTGTGAVANSPEAFVNLLCSHMEAWRTGAPVQYSPRAAALNELTWDQQTEAWYRFILEQHRERATPSRSNDA